jgi:O-antigen/teichoic acid export membrane protein
MQIDCSKNSNKGDLLALIAIFALLGMFAAATLLAVYVDTFWAGFLSATIIWKWKHWIYNPIDRILDKLWSQGRAT